jgi:uncharacterized RDD family membrane protein YckC
VSEQPAGSAQGLLRSAGALAELGMDEDLVTGEAVVLDLRPASFASRSLALALDLVVMALTGLLLGWLITTVVAASDAAASGAISLVTGVGVLVGLPVTVETLTRGRSLGKLAAGLRVVRDDGGPIRFRHALIRGLVAVVEIYLTTGSVALISSLANRRGKRIGDMLAGTYVVRERTAGRVPPVATMPAELAGWAAGCDLGRVPDRLAAAARQFLGRAASLHPASRQQLGLALADQLRQHVAPAPPAGTHPEAFIAAVLAERRERDLVRLRREADQRAERARRRAAASPLSTAGTCLVGEGESESPR